MQEDQTLRVSATRIITIMKSLMTTVVQGQKLGIKLLTDFQKSQKYYSKL